MRRVALILLLAGLAFGLAHPAMAQDDELCEMCHDDPSLTKMSGGVEVSLHANSQMIGNSVHDGLACVDCHSSLAGSEDFPHAETLPDVSCADCHPGAFEEYMIGFRQHLTERGFTNVPQCSDCHGTHEISEITDTRQVCGVCHSDKVREFEKSVHFQAGGEDNPIVSCTSCHDAHDKTDRGEMLPRNWRLKMVDKCLECHNANASNYLDSRHYNTVQRGDAGAPICIDCHSTHAVFRVEDTRSPVHIDNMDNTCDQCHPGHEASLHRKSGVDPRLMTCAACHTGHETRMKGAKGAVFGEALPETCNRCHGEERHADESLAHGEIMLVDPDGTQANCTDCHVYHYDMPEGRGGEVSSLRQDCANCHAEESSDYARSAHGVAHAKGHEEAPTCETCHGSEEIQRVAEQFDGQSIISLCSDCHADREVTLKFQLNPNVVGGYLKTYHGQAYALGYQGEDFATCISCHDNHLILPKENPQSSIAQQNIIDTCSRCHEDANKNFVGMLQHYNPMTAEEHPVLDFIHVAMIWLLRITLTIFGIHTLLWLGRTIVDWIRHGKPKRPKSKVRYKRFGAFDRFLHALVIISFLTLAMTGLPLKYSHTEASYWIAANVLDLHTMALLHRIGAVITFTYFGLHLFSLVVRAARKKRPFRDMLWGENSMVPQPHDFKEFVQHIGYFLGLAKKPQFGRYAYWEKFDYWAVFWGVAVIGASGLTLWFPTFFTRILPGWVLNAAHIIHSEEALLATGFIFTIHFFNEHLRPENFPFDEVIFTGTTSEHYMKDHRARWYRQLQEEGRLQEVETKHRMALLPRVLLYIFGFSALLVGLGLLALILIGTFTA